jgi:Zn-dependent protease
VLFEPNETAFDLRFRIFRIPVRVHPFFWLISALFGWPGNIGPMTMPFLLVWIVCVFVSILIHEMGHVLMGRLFGSDGYIVLYSFGGIAVGSSDLNRRWQRVLVYFAGPLAQFVLLGLTLAVLVALSLGGRADFHPLVERAFFALVAINLFWPLLNLLPIWPLDGGRISREFFEAAMPERGTRVALGVSLVVAGLLAVNAVATLTGRTLIPVIGPLLGGGYLVFLFAMLAIGSWQMLQAVEAERRWRDEHWDREG